MTTQSYYKDRLGFDPREALYDTSTGRSRRSTSGQHVEKHHITTEHHHQHHRKQREHHVNNNHYSQQYNNHVEHHQSSASYNNQHHQSSASYGSVTKKQKQSQDGYEDALTQFKGTMWELFVENWDIIGMLKTQYKMRDIHMEFLLNTITSVWSFL